MSKKVTLKDELEKQKKKMKEVKEWKPLYAEKIYKNKKAYSRKDKHKNF